MLGCRGRERRRLVALNADFGGGDFEQMLVGRGVGDVAISAGVVDDRAVHDLVLGLDGSVAVDADVGADLGAGEDVVGVDVAGVALFLGVGLMNVKRLGGGAADVAAVGVFRGIGVRDAVEEKAERLVFR